MLKQFFLYQFYKISSIQTKNRFPLSLEKYICLVKAYAANNYVFQLFIHT